MFAELDRDLNGEEELLLVNALYRIDAAEEIPLSWLQKKLSEPDANDYVVRFAKRLTE